MKKLLAALHLGPVTLLVLATVCFAGGFLASRYGQLPGVVRRTDLRRLHQLVRAAETVASCDADTVAAQVQRSNYSFARLLRQAYYPTFIFQDGKLRYWSSAALRPTPDDLLEALSETAVETAFGQFLLVRRRVGHWHVLAYVPLERHYGISNRYLREGGAADVFQGLRLRVVRDSVNRRLPAFRDPDGRYLFSIQQQVPYRLTGQYAPLGLLLLGVLFYGAGWAWLALRYWRTGRVGAALAVLAGPLLLLRGALLYWGLPFSLIELPLFDPRVYAASRLSPSLGDLLLNAVLAFGGAAAVGVLWVRSQVAARMRAPRTLRGQMMVTAGLALLFWALLQLLYGDYTAVLNSSQLSLDVTRGLPVTGFRLALAFALVVQTGAYLIGFFLLTQLADVAMRHVSESFLVPATALMAVVLLVVGVATGAVQWQLLGVLATFGALVRLARLRAAVLGGYQLWVLGVLLGALAAATGALALHQQFEQQLLVDKQRLASSLLVDNDFQGEFLLEERIHKIVVDPFVRQALVGALGQAGDAERRVDRQYLGDYFDKYESQVTLYDAAGQPLNAPAGPSLASIRRAIRRNATRTDQRGVYLLRSDNSFSSRHYVALATVGAGGAGRAGPLLGTVRVDLTLKKLSSYSVLPELLVDQKFFQPSVVSQFSYAGYDHGRLVYSEGEFDYANRLPAIRLRDPHLYANGLELGGFQHLAVRGARQRTVVMTTARYSLADGLANFSFQFLLSVVFWLVLGGAWLLLRRRAGARLRLNFSGRIQLLLNMGIVVPLLVVSIATASQLIASYRLDLIRTYERRGRLALNSVRAQRRLLVDSTARPVLAALARTVAALTETDVNLYNARGELLASSQPLIFEAGLLGPLLNPEAVATLRERGAPRALLTEQAGSLAFTALYLPVRASAGEVADSAGYPLMGARRRVLADDELLPDDAAGPIVGYVGVPFFDSAKNLDTKLTGLFTTLLNIVTLMFLLFLGLAFVAARQLTAPLKRITERLTRTTLTGENEPIPYRSSDDEIGLLVREYNAMIGKLEASRRELAAQEKEVAWREMARQVAHEIKNPLTPMKLSLQFLQKAIAERRPNAEELIGRISQTLITQVDVLSDIATSFSTFTNLPAMRPERLDVVAVLRHCADLFQQSDGDEHDEHDELHFELPPDGAFIVFADESLLVRTFNNLLLNAKQAVPPGRPARQTVALRAEGSHKVLITIADNGTGIADDVRSKMFVPNFTTKESGSGIGLAVAKRGIESAGGRIWFETVVGEGTQFYIELPLAG